MVQGNKNSQIEEIDLMELILKLWNRRKLILKWCGVAIVIGLIVGFSIPKTYQVSVVLTPEVEQQASSSLSSVASIMGVNLNSSVDAIGVQVYKDVITSTPFLYKLLNLEVETKDGELKTTLVDYMLNYQKLPWWSHIIRAPFRVLGWFMSLFQEEDVVSGGELDMYNLPKKERDVINFLAENIMVSVDKKTSKIVMSLEMQDPLVVATVMNAVVDNFKEYMEDYRTTKARQDLENLNVICEERKKDYYEIQQVYAKYEDENKSIALQSAQAESKRLRQEVDLAYQVYSQVA